MDIEDERESQGIQRPAGYEENVKLSPECEDFLVQ
ncbi:hypothetical protein KIPB_011172, partial [Kipferlia bialata]|eukprot:g11172.t1